MSKPAADGGGTIEQRLAALRKDGLWDVTTQTNEVLRCKASLRNGSIFLMVQPEGGQHIFVMDRVVKIEVLQISPLPFPAAALQSDVAVFVVCMCAGA